MLNQYGARQGGPIVLPGVYDGRGKAFFFFNYEELRLPNNFTRNRTIANPRAQSGVFQYNVTSGGATVTREANLAQIAAQNGIAARRSTRRSSQILNQIRASVQTTGLRHAEREPEHDELRLAESRATSTRSSRSSRSTTTSRRRHRLSGTYYWQVVRRDPDHLNGDDVRFPGALNYSRYTSYRPQTSCAAALDPVAEHRQRDQGRRPLGSRLLRRSARATDRRRSRTRAATRSRSATSATRSPTGTQQTGQSWRSASNWNIDDTLSWQRGTHSLSLGGSVFFGRALGEEPADGADDQLRRARSGSGQRACSPTRTSPARPARSATMREALFGLLTGRVTSIGGNLVLDENTNQYVYLGTRNQAGRQNEFALFVQDSWRATPTLTINGGVRWDVADAVPAGERHHVAVDLRRCVRHLGHRRRRHVPLVPAGRAGRQVPQFVQYDKGDPGWNTDWNNLAPNVGVAWRPNVQSGWLRTILGDPEQATLRGGYSVAYNREGFAVYTGQYGANPGSQISVTRSNANGNLIPPGESVPLLLQPARAAGSAAVQHDSRDQLRRVRAELHAGVSDRGAARAAPTRSTSSRPTSRSPSRERYNISFQRSISRQHRDRHPLRRHARREPVDRRGVQRDQHHRERLLRRVQARDGEPAGQPRRRPRRDVRLHRGRRARRRCRSISRTSTARATSATRRPTAARTGPTARSSAGWRTGARARTTPRRDLDGNATRRANALAAGSPGQLLRAQSDATARAATTRASACTTATPTAATTRCRSKSGAGCHEGFQINGSYQYALENGSAFLGRHWGRVLNPDRQRAPRDQDAVGLERARRTRPPVRHRHQPVARRRASAAGSSAAPAASRRATLNFGNVRLVGMTVDELTKEYHFRLSPDPLNPGRQIVTMLPEDIILNTRRAYSLSVTNPTGYSDLGVPEGRYIAPANSESCIQLKSGDCAPRHPAGSGAVVHPHRRRARRRSSPPASRVNFEMRVDILNLFDNVNFTPVGQPGQRRGHLPSDRRPIRTRTTRSIPAAGSARSSGGSTGSGTDEVRRIRSTRRPRTSYPRTSHLTPSYQSPSCTWPSPRRRV